MLGPALVADGPVACFSGRLDGLQVSVRHGSTTLGQSTTNSEGEFAVVLPRGFDGPVDVVVDGVPRPDAPQSSPGFSSPPPVVEVPRERRIILRPPNGWE